MYKKVKNNMKLFTLALLTLPLMAWGQDKDPASSDDEVIVTAEQALVNYEITVGLYYLDDPSYRYGKFTGLTDDGAYALVDFRIDKRPAWDSDDTTRWSFQGWRLGLDSRRLLFKFNDQVTQSFKADYREIPNYRFSDGLTPYQGVGSNTLPLASGWVVAPGSSNTTGFSALYENLADLKIDTKRRRLDLSYNRKLSETWNLALDYRHETKKGERTIGSIFGYTGGNPRAVILPAPVDYQTDNFEAMFNYATTRFQFGVGVYASFFSNDETALIWQNAYGRQSQWAASVEYPGSQGQLALEPDNSYVQFKAYGGFNISSSTRLSADVSFGQMEQDDAFLPYTINPDLIVHTPLPYANLDGKVDTTMFNIRLTSQLARRLGLALNYHYDDHNNKTQQGAYPNIGGDSENQKPDEDARVNLPFSYKKQKADAKMTYRLGRGIRFKGGLEYLDNSREYSEVTDSDEFAWLAGIKFGGLDTAAFNFDYRNSSRNVDEYVGNALLIESHLPGVIPEDEWENLPNLRKYYLTDRDRDEFRFRADVFPIPELNFGLSYSQFKDDYDEGFFGLNKAKIHSTTVDFGWYPVENVSITAYYSKEKYDAEQSSLSFSNTSQAEDPDREWFADSTDKVDTYNISLAFNDVGADQGWRGFSLGFDYTYSNSRSLIDVTAVTLTTAPLPELTAKLRSIGFWGGLNIGSSSSLRLSFESSKLATTDFALDGVVPDTLANVLLLGEGAANYDIILITGSWTYRF